MLAGQVAIVTGAGRGIGAAAAALLAAHGARVVVSDLDAAPAEAVVAGILGAGGEALAFPGDVTDAAFPEALVSAAVAHFGGLNILVNNAGYTWDGMLHKMSDAQWAAMLDVHATAPFRLIRAAAPHLRDAARAEQAEGRVVSPRCVINVSSTSGLHGNLGQANYATAKMGIVGLTKTLAKEWGAFGVRCNAVAFGYIDTRLTQARERGASVRVGEREVALGIPEQLRGAVMAGIPLGRAGTVEEAAGGILLLASPFAGYINGHVLEVTGGMGI